MLIQPVEDLLSRNADHYLIPVDVVANVQTDNNLYHAFLVLTKVKYSKIPVLDHGGHFEGLVSLPLITEQMLGFDQLNTEILLQKRVCDVMETQVKTVHDVDDVEETLHLMIDNPFVPVVDEQQIFQGIVTRREFMKSFNFLTHEIGKQYDMIEKDFSTSEKAK
ncbi:CBS domain-containing protein [Lactiplantibacillus plantarum]|uniref:cyclic-di-AMP-binding protein CbpB n=1 Tax=Lactiplantibacillus plantarum TaxID=1590 RepID=UPI0007BBC1BF|nr:cyclic-di-AMP-binding protein CbpB [Lactiplantibacillus plantarum]AYE58144.1 CBS domain-containing protein [Lactiplantibacillus plantarum]KZU54637.1 Inosine-5'-monophosphate dehydrogenase [Lactiplantibacillus plantarum]MCT3258990.1 CBS domain-containing protein [Lactiplantibacillus plantarum]QBJ55826.1 CBS domain-containing protein [Lactiplantibacillus plantarum]